MHSFYELRYLFYDVAVGKVKSGLMLCLCCTSFWFPEDTIKASFSAHHRSFISEVY